MKYTVIQAFLLVGLWQFANGQSTEELKSFKPSKGTVCYMGTTNAFTTVPAPEAFLGQRKSGARTKATANIEVTYQDFSPEAQAAFQYAVEIWESLLVSDVTIHILARWAPLGTNVLGGASPGAYFTNFEGAPKQLVWYPAALAEKLAHKELNAANEPDIVATFNSENSDWHYSVDTDPPAGKFDLVSIVLHEIGHGLGITHSYSVESGIGLISGGFQGLPVVFETNLENLVGQNIVTHFQDSTSDLGFQILGKLFYSAPIVNSTNDGQRARVYTPSTYSPGSSIAHLDENTYVPGNANSLMTPFISPGERIHDPGPISLNILSEMGWRSTSIRHTPLRNTENVTDPFVVTAIIQSDNGYEATSVKVQYTINGTDFVSANLSSTGNAHEFQTTIPNGNTQYSYAISVKDNDQRTLTKPGPTYRQGSAVESSYYSFEVGPDAKTPFINHVPKAFIKTTDPLLVEAIVSDNIGIANVLLEYRINGVSKPNVAMLLRADTDSTYFAEVTFPTGSLNLNDKIEYRIKATDAAVAANVTTAPSATGYYEVAVTGLEATRDFYSNDFNIGSTDFFGTGFAITTPTGFANAAIHSEHPYPQGTGAPGDSIELIYQLKIPIRIASHNAVMKFDEIVLVEPGDEGSVFGDQNFFDYVVVEASTDGGQTWSTVADGYDAQSYSEWLTRYNSSIVNNVSTATGDPTLYRTRTLDLSKKFSIGSEVAFRFRLHSDPLAAGWGWSIDNLKIQIDETPPVIQHQQFDYLLAGTASADIKVKAQDPSGLGSLVIEYYLNSGTPSATELLIDPTVDQYSLNLSFAGAGLQLGDTFFYRVKASDKLGNEGAFPSSGYFTVAVVDFGNPISSFVSDFDSGSDGVSGNFFVVTQPAGFTNKAMHSAHPYLSGTSIDEFAYFSWLVRKAIKIDATNPYVSFDEIVAVDNTAANPTKDNVVVEATKDGVTWEPIAEAYGTALFSEWRLSFNNGGSPNSSLLRNHRINLLAAGKFVANDVVLVRFRLTSDATTTGWGWMVDNLSIQGPITGIQESATALKLIAFPNPARDAIQLQLDQQETEGLLQVYSAQGILLETRSVPASQAFQAELQVSGWPAGIYVARFSSTLGTVSTRFAVVK